MKTLIIFLGLATFFQSCGIVSTKDVHAEISGTYVTEWENEYSKAKDTLVLHWAKGTNRYDIIRKTFYIKRVGGKSLPGKTRQLHWTGIYDRVSQTILVSNNGRTLTVDPKQKSIQMGSAVYRQI